LESSGKTFFADLKNDIAEYVELRLEAIKFSAYEKTAKMSAGAASVLVGVYLFLFFQFFLFVSLSFYLASVTGSNALGFGLVSLFYFVLLLFFLVFRKKIFGKFITNKIVRELTDDEETVS
jgi:hypothetical protein